MDRWIDGLLMTTPRLTSCFRTVSTVMFYNSTWAFKIVACCWIDTVWFASTPFFCISTQQRLLPQQQRAFRVDVFRFWYPFSVRIQEGLGGFSLSVISKVGVIRTGFLVRSYFGFPSSYVNKSPPILAHRLVQVKCPPPTPHKRQVPLLVFGSSPYQPNPIWEPLGYPGLSPQKLSTWLIRREWAREPPASCCPLESWTAILLFC